MLTRFQYLIKKINLGCGHPKNPIDISAIKLIEFPIDITAIKLIEFPIEFIFLLFFLPIVMRITKIFPGNFFYGSMQSKKLWLYLIVFILISQIMLYISDTIIELKLKKLEIFKCILSFTIVSISCYLLFIKVLSYFNCFILSVLACGAILCWRFTYYWIIPKINIQHKVLFLGTDELSKNVVKEILADDHPKFKVAGFIGNDPALVGKSIVNPKVLGLIKDVGAIIKKEKIKKVVASYTLDRGEFSATDFINVKFNGIEVLDLHTFYENFKGKILLEGLRPSWLIYSQGFKKTQLTKLIKRIFDILLSTIVLVLILPISIITALLIKLESKGPIIYKQERVSENGRIFKLLKFRYMRTDMEENTGPIWAEEEDDRITLIGKFIRKVHIDEIPLMINVLKGDMSFIGPSPERPYFVKMLSQKIRYYDQRHTVKPGITGWAAVNYKYGATISDAVEKLQYDLYYIKNISLFLDLIIIFKTISILLGRKDSY